MRLIRENKLRSILILAGIAFTIGFSTKSFSPNVSISNFNIFKNYKEEVTIRSITLINNGIYLLMFASKNYEFLSNELIVEARIVPDSMYENILEKNSKIKNEYGGDVIVAPLNYHNNYDAFSITYKDIPKDACVVIAKHYVDKFIKVYVKESNNEFDEEIPLRNDLKLIKEACTDNTDMRFVSADK